MILYILMWHHVANTEIKSCNTGDSEQWQESWCSTKHHKHKQNKTENQE